MALTATFQHNGATVTVQKSTVTTRLRLWQLHQSMNNYGTGGVSRSIANTLCFYLAHTVKVDGSLGFPVPVENTTHDELLQFLQGFAEADEQLVILWDDTIAELKHAMNDPDLLPPDEVGEKKATPPKSKASA